MEMMTQTQAEEARKERRDETGTEPPCPFCNRPRVSRTDYIRCNPCGVNWLNEEMHLPNYLTRDPRVARQEAARTVNATKPTANTSKADAEHAY
jgi:ribosomal protein L37AE/L43A